MSEIELWKDVTTLYSYDSAWNIDKMYKFPKGRYQVSSLGRFKRDGIISTVKPDDKLDIVYSLKGHRFKLHQIVLQTFKPDGIKDGFSPDHINRNRLDNRLSNLRWGDYYTQSHNRDNTSYKYKKVFCITNNKTYNSCQEAEEDLGLVKNTVSRVARDERKIIHGYRFYFEDAETAQMNIFDLMKGE